MSRLLSFALVVTLALMVVADAAEAGPRGKTASTTTKARQGPPPGGTGVCGCGEGVYPRYRCRPEGSVNKCAPSRWQARYYRPACYDAGWYGRRCKRFGANGWRRGTGPTRR